MAMYNDRYEILGTLGRGAMGTVYRGKTRPDGAPAVFKTIVDTAKTPRYLDREYRILSNLSHPNLVRIYERFILNDMVFIAMERIDGVSLFDASRRQDLGPWATLLRGCSDSFRIPWSISMIRA